MSASFPSSAKTFTTKLAGDTIQPAHVNDMQAEITAIETALVGGTLPAANGSALTNLNAANVSGTLGAMNGSALTNLTAANLTGALPAISGALLTALNAANVSSGILPDARIPGLTTDGVSRITALAFKAAQAASADANTLDDYEEGTWTPTLTNVTLGNGAVSGSYVKIGKWVWFTAVLTWGSTTSAAGTFGLSLPITANSATGAPPIGTGFALDSGVASYPIQVVAGGTGRMDLLAWNASATYTTRDFVNATVPFTWGTVDEARVTGFYEAAA